MKTKKIKQGCLISKLFSANTGILPDMLAETPAPDLSSDHGPLSDHPPSSDHDPSRKDLE